MATFGPGAWKGGVARETRPGTGTVRSNVAGIWSIFPSAICHVPSNEMMVLFESSFADTVEGAADAAAPATELAHNRTAATCNVSLFIVGFPWGCLRRMSPNSSGQGRFYFGKTGLANSAGRGPVGRREIAVANGRRGLLVPATWRQYHRNRLQPPETTVGQECPTYNGRRMGIPARRVRSGFETASETRSSPLSMLSRRPGTKRSVRPCPSHPRCLP